MNASIMNIAAMATRVILPPIIILGISANLLNIIILRRTKLKRHSCSLYFVTLSLNNLFYSAVCITYNLLLDGYNIDIVRYSRFFCKLNSYFLNLCPNIAVYMLVLASIDRYFSSSIDARRRRFSNIDVARRSILVILIFEAIFMIGTLIIFDAYNDGTIGCTSQSNILFNQIFLTMEVVIYVIIAPFLMILFGLLTIHNINYFRQNHHIHFRYRRSDRQMTRMLIIQVTTHILLSLPFCAMFFILILPPSFQSTIIFYFLFVIFKIPFYISFITPFFLYILSAKIYRTELCLVLKRMFHTRRFIIAVHPIRMNQRN